MDEEKLRLLPISVLTGFLGSGKTTVLNRLIQQTEMSRTLVIINEFGEIGLDSDLMATSNDEVVVEMASGCLCCTIRGDLVRALREAPSRFASDGKLSFDRVVIETTGLADPAPILHTLMTDSFIVRRYRLDGVITTCDAVNAHGTLDNQIESVKQAAVADRLLLTKTDLVSQDALYGLQERLRNLNPAAPQVVAKKGVVDPISLFDAGLYNPETKSLDVQRWLKTETFAKPHAHHDHDYHDVNRHDEHIKALCLTIDQPISAAALEAWLDVLMTFQGPNLLRIKGVINVVEVEQPVVVHAVQHIFHPPITLDNWPTTDRRSRIVFITRDIDEKVIRDTLNMFARDRKGSAHDVSETRNAEARTAEAQ